MNAALLLVLGGQESNRQAGKRRTMVPSKRSSLMASMKPRALYTCSKERSPCGN